MQARFLLAAVSAFKNISWEGVPNSLSPKHVEWVGIEKAASATRKRETDYLEKKQELKPGMQAVSHLTVNNSKSSVRP